MESITPKEVFLALLSNPNVTTALENATQLMEISFGLAIEFNAAAEARNLVEV